MIRKKFFKNNKISINLLFKFLKNLNFINDFKYNFQKKNEINFTRYRNYLSVSNLSYCDFAKSTSYESNCIFKF